MSNTNIINFENTVKLSVFIFQVISKLLWIKLMIVKDNMSPFLDVTVPIINLTV